MGEFVGIKLSIFNARAIRTLYLQPNRTKLQSGIASGVPSTAGEWQMKDVLSGKYVELHAW